MVSPAIKTALAALLLAGAFSSVKALEMEDGLVFGTLPYPIEIKLPGGRKPGAVLFESPSSEPTAFDYDTVLIQGEMPAPAISIRLETETRGTLSGGQVYKQAAFHRAPGGRFWMKYSLPGTRSALRLVVTNQDLKEDSSLTIYSTEFLRADSMREEREPAAADTGVSREPLYLPADAPFNAVRRAQWNAAPPKEPYSPHTPFYFTLHHTQGHYPKNLEEASAEMRFIQDYHQNAKGWIDIGYHFLIDPMGDIFEGRPIGAVGAHVKGRNTGNIGISIMGNYQPPVSDTFTGSALSSFVALGRYLKDTYSVDVSSFYAHRDIGPTDCPGSDLYARKELLRSLIFDPQTRGIPADPASAPPLTPAQSLSLEKLMRYLSGK